MSTSGVENIPLRLREEIANRGWSLAEASRRAGESSPQRLKDVTAGRQKCPVELLARLAPLEVDISYVLTGERSTTKPIDAERMVEIAQRLEKVATAAGKRWPASQLVAASVEVYNFFLNDEMEEEHLGRVLKLVVNR